MSITYSPTIDGINAATTGYPKYRLEKADGTLVQDWTHIGVGQWSDSGSVATPTYSVQLSLDPMVWYVIAWDFGDGDGITTESINASTGLADEVETGETLLQLLRLLRAAHLGLAGVSGNTVTFKRPDGTTTALTVDNDVSGNRTTVTKGTV
jgi:hypothetical protein